MVWLFPLRVWLFTIGVAIYPVVWLFPLRVWLFQHNTSPRAPVGAKRNLVSSLLPCMFVRLEGLFEACHGPRSSLSFSTYLQPSSLLTLLALFEDGLNSNHGHCSLPDGASTQGKVSYPKRIGPYNKFHFVWTIWCSNLVRKVGKHKKRILRNQQLTPAH